MAESPTDALRRMKEERLQREGAAAAKEARTSVFPALAKQRLHSIAERLEAECPKELHLIIQEGPGGLLGADGVASLSLFLSEKGREFAHGFISVGSDEKVVLQDCAPKGQWTSVGIPQEFGSFSDDDAVEFLAQLITTYYR